MNPARTLALAGVALTAPVQAQTSLLFPAQRHASGQGPEAFLVRDMDADAVVDLVAVHKYSDDLALLFGDGLGSFGKPQSHALPEQPTDVEVGDLNGDGALDVVVAHVTSVGPSVLLAGAPGTLGPAVTHGGTVHVREVLVADIDGDGDLDLVGYGTGQPAQFFAGDGLGGFAAPAPIATGGFHRGGALLDADLDGGLDLVLHQAFGIPPSSARLDVFLGDGAGGFTAGPSSAPWGPAGQGLELADFDGDGLADVALDPDLALANFAVLRGDGQGGFGPLVQHPVAGVSGLSSMVPAAGDLDGDGAPDVAIAGSHTEGGGAILMGDGQGGFGPAAPLGVPVNTPMRLLAEVTLDGAVDYVLVDGGDFTGGPPGYFEIYEGDGQGGFHLQEWLDLGPPAASARASVLVDLDLDGHGDLVVAEEPSTTPGTIRVLPGLGAGAFGAAWSTPPIARLSDVAAIDLHGDGLADVAAVSEDTGRLYTLGGDGTGALSPPSVLPLVPGARSIAAADLDGDGRGDLAVAGREGDAVAVVLGSNSGTLSAPVAFPAGLRPMVVRAGDANGDGQLDLLTANEGLTGPAGFQWIGPSELAWLAGDGQGGFAAPVVLDTAGRAVGLALGDWNGDGDLDAAVAHRFKFQPYPVAVYAGDGQGGLGLVTELDPPGFFGELAELETGDFNGDGAADLVALDTRWEAAAVFVGDGHGGFSEGREFAAGHEVPRGLSVGDVDADGRTDLLVALDFNGVLVIRGRPDPPAGTLPTGTGTAGCAGGHGLVASGPPAVGSADFGLTCTNAPRSSTGLGLLSTQGDPVGSDPFGLGFALHVGVLFPAATVPLSFASDQGGTAFAALPIPAVPALAGKTVYAQAFWPWLPAGPCAPSPLGFSSSAGLSLTVGP